MRTPNTIPIFPEGKISIHRSDDQLARTLAKIESSQSVHPDNKSLLARFIRDCRLGKTVSGTRKRKIGSATCLKHLFGLSVLEKSLQKSFQEVTQEDMERFIERLENGLVARNGARPYSADTQSGIKKSIRKFWKWKDGNNKTYPELVEWIDTYVRLKEVPALARSEVETMIDHTGSQRNKALIMVLFDSGARIEELLNVRLKPEHVFWRSELGCYMLRLEHSKTKPRTISLPLSTRLLGNWLAIHPEAGNTEAQLFPLAYPNLRMILKRIGEKALGKPVTPHVLRHSSATFYANRLKNPYKLCYRYGWAMSSDMVNRYLDREGILEEESVAAVNASVIDAAKNESRELSEQLLLMKETNSELSAELVRLKTELVESRSGGNPDGLIRRIALQQEEMARVLEQVSGRKFDVTLAATESPER